MRKVISQKFFQRSAFQVAKELLGKYLVRKKGKKEQAMLITEVEVYDGFKDQASHAFRGKTERTSIMFGKGGYFYVYLIYGMYEMLNIVTGKEGYPSAILIRGGMIENKVLHGPGVLTKALHINRALNGKKAEKKSGLWIEDRGIVIKKSKIKRTPRIGVLYAGPIWSKKLHRFVYHHEN